LPLYWPVRQNLASIKGEQFTLLSFSW